MKLYLATVCFLPLICVVLYPAVFLYRMPFPVWAFPMIAAYFWIGLVVLLVDLWRSQLPSDRKVVWTVVNLLVGVVTLSVYWFVVVKKRATQST